MQTEETTPATDEPTSRVDVKDVIVGASVLYASYTLGKTTYRTLKGIKHVIAAKKAAKDQAKGADAINNLPS